MLVQRFTLAAALYVESGSENKQKNLSERYLMTSVLKKRYLKRFQALHSNTTLTRETTLSHKDHFDDREAAPSARGCWSMSTASLASMTLSDASSAPSNASLASMTPPPADPSSAPNS